MILQVATKLVVEWLGGKVSFPTTELVPPTRDHHLDDARRWLVADLVRRVTYSGVAGLGAVKGNGPRRLVRQHDPWLQHDLGKKRKRIGWIS